MMPLQSLSCDVTVVVICRDVTVLFTICLSLERGGLPLISTTACYPTCHEVEWPLRVNRENVICWWDKLVTLLRCREYACACVCDFVSKPEKIWKVLLLSFCPAGVGWSHAYNSVLNKTISNSVTLFLILSVRLICDTRTLACCTWSPIKNCICQLGCFHHQLYRLHVMKFKHPCAWIFVWMLYVCVCACSVSLCYYYLWLTSHKSVSSSSSLLHLYNHPVQQRT